MLESRIIYAEESMERYLGFKPERSVSEHTAYAMAIEAYAVAARLNSLAPVGVACTAALATDHLRRGDDHAWLAIATSGHVFAHHIVLNKDLARAEQEDKLADIIVRLMATPEVWSSTVDYLAEAYGSFTPGSFHRPTSLDALVNA